MLPDHLFDNFVSHARFRRFEETVVERLTSRDGELEYFACAGENIILEQVMALC